MKPGAIVVIVIAVAYTGFELYAVSRNGYRMQPEFIFSQHVGAAHAVELCRADKSGQRAQFDRNFAYARQRAREALADDAANGDVDAALTALIAATRNEVEAMIAERGCDDIEAWKLVRRFDLLAKANPPIQD